jgi:aminoglycoside 6'-N-acetyltransferase
MPRINFRKLQISDLELIYDWFRKPEINKWYAEGKTWSFSDIEQKYLPRIQGKENTPGFIIEFDEIAVGFIQYYPLTAALPNSLTQENIIDYQIDLTKSAGIDLFIGETLLLGKGYGPQIIVKFLQTIVFKKYDLVFIDPDKINTRAIKAYQRSGFQPVEDHQDEQTVLMFMFKEALNNPSPFCATLLRKKS